MGSVLRHARGGIIAAFGCAAITAGCGPWPAVAQDVSEFYRGKTITTVVGYSPGGGYDVTARLIAQHLGRFIPGSPTIVVQNMPGAGSRAAGMYLYNIAPKDGTYIGTIGRSQAVAPILEKGVKFDGRGFTWLGSVADDNSICVASSSSKVQSWQDMLSSEFTVGALAPGDNTVTVPTALRSLFGANIKIVSGYPGTAHIFLAMQRGEVDGACGVSWRPILMQHRDWIDEKKITVLVEVALQKDPTLKDTPQITDFVRDPDQSKILTLLIATQAMARSFMAPPDIPESRKQALRRAFDATVKDPAFLADAAAASLYVNPMSGAEIDKLLQTLYATPKELAEKASRVAGH